MSHTEEMSELDRLIQAELRGYCEEQLDLPTLAQDVVDKATDKLLAHKVLAPKVVSGANAGWDGGGGRSGNGVLEYE